MSDAPGNGLPSSPSSATVGGSPASVLAVDAMGGDLGPAEVVAGVALSLQEQLPTSRVILVGDQGALEKLLPAHGLQGNPRVEIVHASQVIAMDDKPITAIKQKKDSSMLRAIELVKDGRAQGVLSLGNTGALMAAGTLRLRPMPGIERPALGTVIPSRGHRFVLIDAGANPDASAMHLFHNALLGSHYAQAALGVAKPRVGLLTIGTEEGKGSDKVLEAHALLKAANGILNYFGPIEGFQLFSNEVDVVVCDGFTGNILLKALEACFDMLKSFVKDELMANPLRMSGAFLARGAFAAIKRELDPASLGGAPFLGLNRIVVKAHGSSNRAYVNGALRMAFAAVSHDFTGAVRADLDKLAASAPSITG